MSYSYYGYDTKVFEKNYNALGEAIKSELEKANPRREVTQQLQVYTCPLVDLISKAEDFAFDWKKKLEDVTVEHNAYEEDGFSRSELFLEVAGLETDSQYHIRLWQIHEANCRREEHDREEFKRLSAKFAK